MERTGFGTLAIFGNGPRAVELVLRRVLRYRDVAGPLLILDYVGRGAQAISRDASVNLGKREVLWIDLADWHRPAGLFSPTASPHFERLMAFALRGMRNLAHQEIKDECIDWAAGAAARLARDGAVGLGAVLRCLSSQPTRRWFLDTHPDSGDLGRMIDVVNQALKYPGVYSLSEGNNRIRLSESLRLPRNIWIEMPAEHFEAAEHVIAVHLVNCAVQDALLGVEESMRAVRPREKPFIIHMFPPTGVEPFPRWVLDTVDFARHVAVFHVDSGRMPSRSAVEWSRQAEQVWIMGGMTGLEPDVHVAWLDQRDIGILKGLKADSMLVRAGGQGGASRIVAGIGAAEGEMPYAHVFRMKASKTRQTSPVKQFSTAAGVAFDSGDRQGDLYKRLCNRDLLRWGWARVNRHNMDSCGVDNVTIRQFGDNIEAELDSLVEELETRSYRCRPLKRIEISKQDGGKRPIGLPCVRDRLVQTACLVLLEPIFEPTFSYGSFGFRPGRNAHHALAMVRSMIAAGRGWVVAADIQKCFDSIDHDILRGLLEARVGDSEFLDTVDQFVGADVLDAFELIPADLGVPQGESLSPLLANIYLDQFDRHCEDPYFGFMHGSKRNQGSMVFDLIEEFRAPFADRFVFGMLGRGFKPKTGEHGHLRVETKGQLAHGFSRRWSEPVVWRSRRMTPGQVLEHQAASLVRLIERKGKYLPYRARI